MAATHTPNLNLNKPDRQDLVSVIHDINDNMDKIDEEAGMVDDGIAIVIDGNTAPRAISSGQYLLIKNHSTLATGGYHATANIANGESVTSSNVAVDSDGIANALNSKISTVKSIEITHGTINAGTASTIETQMSKRPYVIGYVVSGNYNSDVIPWSYYYTGTTFISRVKNTGANQASNISVTYIYFEM